MTGYEWIIPKRRVWVSGVAAQVVGGPAPRRFGSALVMLDDGFAKVVAPELIKPRGVIAHVARLWNRWQRS